MTRGLRRYHESGQSHFITFSCYRREPNFINCAVYDLFPVCLEAMRYRFEMRIYGYVVMPEHVHLLLSEPDCSTLADVMHYLKLSFTKQLRSRTFDELRRLDEVGAPGSPLFWANLGSGPFWQKRYYDRNVRDAREFAVKLKYLHRNPVKRGLVREPGDWKWSSFRHYAFREMGVVEIESEWTARDRESKMTGRPPRIFLNPG